LHELHRTKLRISKKLKRGIKSRNYGNELKSSCKEKIRGKSKILDACHLSKQGFPML
jgi:hypothetical protein